MSHSPETFDNSFGLTKEQINELYSKMENRKSISPVKYNYGKEYGYIIGEFQEYLIPYLNKKYGLDFELKLVR